MHHSGSIESVRAGDSPTTGNTRPASTQGHGHDGLQRTSHAPRHGRPLGLGRFHHGTAGDGRRRDLHAAGRRESRHAAVPAAAGQTGHHRLRSHGGLLRLCPGAGGHPDPGGPLVGPHRPPGRPGPCGAGGPRRRLRLCHGGQPVRAVRRPGAAGHCGGARHRRQFGGPAGAAAQPPRVGLAVHPAGVRRRCGGRPGHRGSALAAARAHVHAVLSAFPGPGRAAGPAVPAQGPPGHHLGRGSAAVAGAGAPPAVGVQ